MWSRDRGVVIYILQLLSSCLLFLINFSASDNRLNESEGGYENISVIRDMSISDLSLLHYIEDNIEASTLSADCILDIICLGY